MAPALEERGGVASVAEFVCRTIDRSAKLEVKVFSLSTSARDELGVALTRPSSWLRGVRTCNEGWQGRQVIRVGAFASELEFQRYRPRRILATLLADCDLIQVVCGSPAWALAVCGLGKPVAVQCATRAIVERRRRDSTAQGPKAEWRRWMTTLTDRLDRKALRSVDAVQVENRWMFDYAHAVNQGRQPLIRCAPPGIDAQRFQPLAYRDPASDPYILCVGRLDDSRKNVELLLEAYAALPVALRGTARLVLAGSVGPGPGFWARVRQLGLTGRVELVASPTVEELVGLYQRASVFALSSDEEGLGVVILEAMACGVPVVSTRSGGPERVITDGEDGYLVELDDAKAMADRLLRLLSDQSLNRRMGQAARESVMRRYESGIAGTAYLDIYDELLSRRFG